MRVLSNYLSGKFKTVVLCIVFVLIFAGTFSLYHLPIAAVIYPAGICLVIGVFFLLFDFVKVRRTHRKLEELKKRPGELIDVFPAPDHTAEQDYQDIIRNLQRELGQKTEISERKMNEQKEYYTLWAHQIKTPISGMRLMMEEMDDEKGRRLSGELKRIEHYVEMVMTYARLEEGGSDLLFRRQSADALLKACLRRFSGEFIGRRIRLDYLPSDTELVTDAKWFSFVVEQILSNALKYTREGGTIRIYTDPEKALHIADTGIGIAPEDLPRVFEKGYTGVNGRSGSNASGIGLYLCRRICALLHIGLSVTSSLGKGTDVILSLAQNESVPE